MKIIKTYKQFETSKYIDYNKISQTLEDAGNYKLLKYLSNFYQIIYKKINALKPKADIVNDDIYNSYSEEAKQIYDEIRYEYPKLNQKYINSLNEYTSGHILNIIILYKLGKYFHEKYPHLNTSDDMGLL